jgi:phenylacetate-CoA ligase
MRLKGWLGRADQATKIRGQFVHPHQLVEALRRFDGVSRFRLEVDREGERDRMILRCEVPGAPSGLEQALAEAIRAATGLRAEIELVAPGTLPNDGKLIDDRRARG